MQEIARELARLAEVTAQLSDNVDRLIQTTARLAEKLGCSIPETEATATTKPLRRRNLKDALESVLESRERIIRTERLIVAMEQAQNNAAVSETCQLEPSSPTVPKTEQS